MAQLVYHVLLLLLLLLLPPFYGPLDFVRDYLQKKVVFQRTGSQVWYLVPNYKEKGDPMECGSYRGIKLLEHAMNVVEKIFQHRIRQQIDIGDMQFGFTKGKGTTDAIFYCKTDAGEVQR